MTYRQFQKHYKRERLILSAGFAVLMLAVGVFAAVQNPEAFMVSAAEAFENTSEVFGSVFRGVAN